MVHPWWRSKCLPIAYFTLATLGAAVLVSSVEAAGALPPTPGPCAADGVCRPTRATWGYNSTRWRPWPGDPAGMPVVPEEADEEVERALPTLERPEPRKEDLRGPDRPLGPGVPGEMIDDGLPVDTVPPGVAPGDAPSPLEVPGEAFDQPRGIQPQRQPEAPQPQQELFPPEGAQQQLEEFDQPQGQQPQGQQPEEQKMPEVDDLFPDFGLNDGMQLLPQVEDAPPLLPAGLRAAVAQRRSSLAEPPVIAQPATTTEVQAGPASIAAGPSGMPSTPAVVAAAWAEEGEISLVNPAARGVSADADESLEQAIYYEASDMQPSR